MTGVQLTRFHTALSVVLVLTSSCVFAADWFQVEVIAFRYPQETDSSWAAAPDIPDFSGAQRLIRPGADTEIDGADAYVALSSSQLQLAGAAQVLERSNYQVLIHSGWRQPATDSRPVYLATPPADANPAAPTLEGVVRLAVAARAMHISSNFIVHLTDAPIAISETRAVSAGELHYFDHPLLGLLVQVTPVVPDSVAPPLPEP